jgi:hypothetical protein
VKLKSREAIYSYFKEPFGEKVKEATCREINEYCAKFVRDNWGTKNDTLQRYDTHG